MPQTPPGNVLFALARLPAQASADQLPGCPHHLANNLTGAHNLLRGLWVQRKANEICAA